MLNVIELENYRCFENHKIDFRSTTIVVGQNNAGKSTIIEALRLVSIVSSRVLNFISVPKWLDLSSKHQRSIAFIIRFGILKKELISQI